MDSLSFLYSLFNQYIFTDAKKNIDSIELYFNNNPQTATSPLAMSLIDAIRKFDFQAVDIPLFQSILTRSGKNPDECNKILGDIVTAKQYNERQMEPTKKFLEDICADVLVRKATNMFKSSPSEFVRYIKNSNFVSLDRGGMFSSSFKDMNINKLVAEADPGKMIKTGISLIDNSYEPFCLSPRKQITILSTQPGNGKSLLMMDMALNLASQGIKTHYLALGDIDELDFLTRMGAMLTQQTFGQVKLNLVNTYNALNSALGDNLGLTILPAGGLNIDEYVDYMMEHPEYEVLMIDYDGNFDVDMSKDGMYLSIGRIYSALTRLQKAGRTIYVASQSKGSAWKEGGSSLGDLAESSKKGQFADCVVVFDKVNCVDGYNNPNNLGIMRIVKNRRGILAESGYIRLDTGIFKFIPKGLVDVLKSYTDHRSYSSGDIDQMVIQYNKNLETIKSQLGNG